MPRAAGERSVAQPQPRSEAGSVALRFGGSGSGGRMPPMRAARRRTRAHHSGCRRMTREGCFLRCPAHCTAGSERSEALQGSEATTAAKGAGLSKKQCVRPARNCRSERERCARALTARAQASAVTEAKRRGRRHAQRCARTGCEQRACPPLQACTSGASACLQQRACGRSVGSGAKGRE